MEVSGPLSKPFWVNSLWVNLRVNFLSGLNTEILGQPVGSLRVKLTENLWGNFCNVFWVVFPVCSTCCERSKKFNVIFRFWAVRESGGKESACKAGDPGSFPGLGRSPGKEKGNPLQYSCLENPMDRGAWQATVHGVAKSRTWLSNFTLFFNS